MSVEATSVMSALCGRKKPGMIPRYCAVPPHIESPRLDIPNDRNRHIYWDVILNLKLDQAK